jgi:hypothetical protein
MRLATAQQRPNGRHSPLHFGHFGEILIYWKSTDHRSGARGGTPSGAATKTPRRPVPGADPARPKEHRFCRERDQLPQMLMAPDAGAAHDVVGADDLYARGVVFHARPPFYRFHSFVTTTAPGSPIGNRTSKKIAFGLERSDVILFRLRVFVCYTWTNSGGLVERSRSRAAALFWESRAPTFVRQWRRVSADYDRQPGARRYLGDDA